ncbi:hypothetical protein [Paenisporosarcina quisquiliarum]|uniref:hypothetical protein n=1 Tax=Paenisporosarcina quisquiliarum TaxID=365346 RepID=UPI003735EC50
MNPDRAKEYSSEANQLLFTLNGVQVWLDNKFEEEAIADQISDSTENNRQEAIANYEKRHTH